MCARSLYGLFGALVLTVAQVSTVHAASMITSFQGTITKSNDEYGNVFGTSGSGHLVGEAVSGYFLLDSNLAPADSFPDNPSLSQHVDHNGMAWMSAWIEVAGVSYEIAPWGVDDFTVERRIDVFDDLDQVGGGTVEGFLQSKYAQYSETDPDYTIGKWMLLNILIQDNTTNMINGESIEQEFVWNDDPSDPDIIHRGMFNFNSLIYDKNTQEYLDGAFNGGLEFDINQVTVAPVPIPSSVLLLGSGLVGFAGYVRRKREQ